MASKLVRKTLFWIFNLGLALVVLELCARTDDTLTWHAPFWSSYSEEMLFMTDSLGYHLRPGGQFQKWRINQFGFRGPEISREKPAGIKRIITVGASETFGLYESEGMEFPAQLQTLLNQERPGAYEVLNAGIPGISPSRIAHYYETWLRNFSPDIIIYYPTPSFIFEAGQAPPDWRKFQDKAPGFQFTWRIGERIKDLYKKLLPQSLQTYMRQWLIERAIKNHPPDWVISHVPPDKLAAFRTELEELVSVVHASGEEIMLATNANRIDRGETTEEKMLLIAARKQTPDRTAECLMEAELQANQTVREVGSSHNIPVVDLSSIVPKSSDYFADYGHFTNKGAELVARSFMKEILKLDHGTGGTPVSGISASNSQ